MIFFKEFFKVFELNEYDDYVEKDFYIDSDLKSEKKMRVNSGAQNRKAAHATLQLAPIVLLMYMKVNIGNKL